MYANLWLVCLLRLAQDWRHQSKMLYPNQQWNILRHWLARKFHLVDKQLQFRLFWSVFYSIGQDKYHLWVYSHSKTVKDQIYLDTYIIRVKNDENCLDYILPIFLWELIVLVDNETHLINIVTITAVCGCDDPIVWDNSSATSDQIKMNYPRPRVWCSRVSIYNSLVWCSWTSDTTTQ